MLTKILNTLIGHYINVRNPVGSILEGSLLRDERGFYVSVMEVDRRQHFGIEDIESIALNPNKEASFTVKLRDAERPKNRRTYRRHRKQTIKA